MADVTPNWQAEVLKQKIGISDLETRLIRSELEIVEAENKVRIAKQNITSTHIAIKESKAKHAAFMKDHSEELKEQQDDG